MTSSAAHLTLSADSLPFNQVRVDIQYTNRDIATQRAVIGKREIHADITLRTELATWTGVDTQTTWVVHPALPRDTPQDFHLIEKTVATRLEQSQPRALSMCLRLSPA